VTFVKNCTSCATEVLGADSGAEGDGPDDVVVASAPAWLPTTAINASANRMQVEATNRGRLHPAAATSLALQMPSRHVVLIAAFRERACSDGDVRPAGFHRKRIDQLARSPLDLAEDWTRLVELVAGCLARQSQ
jgi:hypothetical protein